MSLQRTGGIQNAAAYKRKIGSTLRPFEQRSCRSGDTEVSVTLCEAWLSQNKWQKRWHCGEVFQEIRSVSAKTECSRAGPAHSKSGNIKKALKSYQQALDAAVDPSTSGWRAR
jgi:hypothetical protein